MVPVVMITGFLGSGKTSLIAKQLDDDKTGSLSVLVHDLGEENIDVAYLQGGEHVSLASTERIQSVSSGQLTASHEAQLISRLNQLAEKNPAAILLESSGANDMTGATKRLQKEKGKWKLISVVTVLDASLLMHYLKDLIVAPLLGRQAALASLVVLNKWDRASMREKMMARRFSKDLSRRTGASLIHCSFGNISSEIILKQRSIPQSILQVDRNAEIEIKSIHLSERRPFHPQRLEDWLCRNWPGIIRVKGFIWLASDMNGIYVLDAAGSQREIGLEGTWYASVEKNELMNDEEVQQLIAEHKWGDRRQMLTVIGSSSGVAAAEHELNKALLSEYEMVEGPDKWIDYPDPLTPQFQQSF